MSNYKTYEVRIYPNGDKYWYLNGKYHREDGPAIEWSNGDKSWYLMGKLHREDGPAFEGSNGHKEWYLMGKLHREDGPAFEGSNGHKEWWLMGKQLTEKEFNRRTKKPCNNKVVEIDGVKYRLTIVED
jgi:hypothetical protein